MAPPTMLFVCPRHGMYMESTCNMSSIDPLPFHQTAENGRTTVGLDHQLIQTVIPQINLAISYLKYVILHQISVCSEKEKILSDEAHTLLSGCILYVAKLGSVYLYDAFV